MTVAELVAFLQTQQQNVLVAYCLHSEQCLMELSDIRTLKACRPRPDGWVHSERPVPPGFFTSAGFYR